MCFHALLMCIAPIDAFVPSVSQCTGIYNYYEIFDMIFSYLSNILIWLWPFRVLHVPSFFKFYQCHMQRVSRRIIDNSTRARRARSRVEIIRVRRASVTLPSLPLSLAGMVSSFKTRLLSITRSAEGWARKKQSVLRMTGPYGGRLNNIETFLLAKMLC